MRSADRTSPATTSFGSHLRRYDLASAIPGTSDCQLGPALVPMEIATGSVPLTVAGYGDRGRTRIAHAG
jgi:hypothetical protein